MGPLSAYQGMGKPEGCVPSHPRVGGEFDFARRSLVVRRVELGGSEEPRLAVFPLAVSSHLAWGGNCHSVSVVRSASVQHG